MKNATCLILSLLIFFQYGICVNVPEQLRGIYGDIEPCDDPILKYNMDEIKALDDREFKLYEIQNEKCENFKLAIIELEQIKAMNKGSWNYVGWFIIIVNIAAGAFIWYGIILPSFADN